jgi:nucleotide-binding universal stress UspA family protein
MPLKDILIHVDGGKRTAAQLDAAINLAKTNDAHLTGIYVRPPIDIPPYIRAEISTEVLSAQDKAARRAAKKARQLFSEKTEGAGISSEWKSFKGDPIEILNVHARYCDVAVVGQRNPDGDEAPAVGGMPDRLILGVGRPILVIPYAGKFPVMGKRIMIAWDASRLATRAVSDAMPFLSAAKKVTVLAVNPVDARKGHGKVPGADMCRHLERHGINAEAKQVYGDDMDIGSMLLSRAADMGIDLFVMGAYGHARWRELVLGGVTRHMLQHMTMPILMTH